MEKQRELLNEPPSTHLPALSILNRLPQFFLFLLWLDTLTQNLPFWPFQFLLET